MARAEPAEEVDVGRRRIRVTRPEKVLIGGGRRDGSGSIDGSATVDGSAGGGVTKAELVAYYRDVSPVALVHLRDRPLMLQRCPDGIGHCFYQKAASRHFPSWVRTVEAAKRGGFVRHVVCNDEATLAYLASQACVTLHTWLSRADRLERPDRVIFDFDPEGRDQSGPAFAAVLAGARAAGELLRTLGLEPFVATTGSRGLHVVAPIDRRTGFDDVRAFARAAADVLAAADPDRLTVEARKERRGGRVLVDVMRNGYAQTAVAPYSVRALPGAPVATPLEWSELADPDLGPQRYRIDGVRRRLDERGDPWADLADHARPLFAARRKLDGLVARSTGATRVRRPAGRLR